MVDAVRATVPKLLPLGALRDVAARPPTLAVVAPLSSRGSAMNDGAADAWRRFAGATRERSALATPDAPATDGDTTAVYEVTVDDVAPLDPAASPADTLVSLEANLAQLPTVEARDEYIRCNRAAIDAAVLGLARGSDDEARRGGAALVGAAEIAGDGGREVLAGSVQAAIVATADPHDPHGYPTAEGQRLLDAVGIASAEGRGTALQATIVVTFGRAALNAAAVADDGRARVLTQAASSVANHLVSSLHEHRTEYEVARAEYFAYVEAFRKEAEANGWNEGEIQAGLAALETDPRAADYRAARDEYLRTSALYAMDLQGAGIVVDGAAEVPGGSPFTGLVDESTKALHHSAALVQTDAGMRVLGDAFARQGEGHASFVDTVAQLKGGPQLVEWLYAAGVQAAAHAEVGGNEVLARRIFHGVTEGLHAHPHLAQGVEELRHHLRALRDVATEAERALHLERLEQTIHHLELSGLPARVGTALRGLGLLTAVLQPGAGPGATTLEEVRAFVGQAGTFTDALAFVAEVFGRKGASLAFSAVTGLFDAVNGTLAVVHHLENGNAAHAATSGTMAASGAATAVIVVLAAAGIVSGGTALVAAAAAGAIGALAGILEAFVLGEAQEDEVKDALEVFRDGAEGA